MSERYGLEDLLRVRQFREDAAAGEVAGCVRRLEEAERIIEERKRELVEYRQWRVEEEASLFDEITGKHVHLKELDELKQAIALMREKEVEYEQRIMDAEAERDKRAGELEAAQEALHAAAREKAKIVEHRKIWADEQKKVAEMAADKEMEDFKAPDRGALTEDDYGADGFGEDAWEEGYHVES